MRTQDQITADAADQRAFSNHSEYEIWADRYCDDCAKDDAATETWCPILSVALRGTWPAEWTRREVPFTSVEGVPMSYEVVDTCTEFERRDDDDGGGDEPPEGPGPYEPVAHA